jgi:hypothetical protein
MFLSMFKSTSVPPLITDGTADPQLLKHYVLLHDMHTGPADR